MTDEQISIKSYFEAMLEALERQMNERLAGMQIAVNKAEAVMNERLAHMNEFRDQINQERSSYVTREFLDLSIRTVSTEVRGLADRGQFNSGREWTVKALFSILGAVLGYLAHFLK